VDEVVQFWEIGSALMQPRSGHFCYAKIVPCHAIGDPDCLRWSMLDLPAAKEGKNQVYLNGKGSQHWLVVTSRYQEQS
jgi:hypothetical protein